MSIVVDHRKWFIDEGNEKLIANYPLNSDSWVLDLGGYLGAATEKVVSKYDCNVLVVEPIKEFCDQISEKFKNNKKVIIENNGISTKKRELILDYNSDGTSSYTDVSEVKKTVMCYPIEYYLKKYKIGRIDLMMVNIEGEEYPLFEKWVKTDFLKKVNYLEIQFHHFMDNSIERKTKIHEDFTKLGFENLWDYEWAFTAWKNKNY